MALFGRQALPKGFKVVEEVETENNRLKEDVPCNSRTQIMTVKRWWWT
jgi:hypothetical protein